MGIIRKQSIQTSILSYLGVVLGYVNVVLLFPKFFAAEEFGLTRVLLAVIGVSSQFALFGLTNAIIRYFPKFSEGDEKTQNGILSWSLISGFIGTAVVAGILLLAQPFVVDHYREKSELFVHFYYLLLPYLLFEVLFQIFTSYSRALYHAVVNVFFREIFLRASTTVLILLFHFGIIEFELFMQLFIAQFGFCALGLGLYLLFIGRFSLAVKRQFITSDFKKELTHYRLFTLLSSVSALFLMNIDVIMISSMIGLDQTAFYAVAFYIVALLNIPRNALGNIAVPVISDAWKRDDRETIQKIYAKTSINQLLIGTLLFVGIWANQANIFEILPPEYAGGKWVLFFVGLARLADVGFGVNGGIITTSKHYKFDTYSNVVLLIVTVLLNLIFIPIYGIEGAAMATAISLTVFNISKYLFLKIKFNFEPFSWKSAAVLILGGAAFGVSLLLPRQPLLIDIAVRSAIIVVIFIPLAISLRLSEDAHEFVLAIKKRFGF
ncbi:MAG: polysaccharide biosynthesis C-terminal domain-containing protein [Flavobacteriales bacterium]|nr:polysaccharide biosynthesis C-terminal domain-containing protein [Flavobacteriales bacterium]